MFRLLKALPLTLAIAVLSIVTTACSTGYSHIRVVNAMSDVTSAVDIDINGTKVVFPNNSGNGLAFDNYLPSTPPATYVSVPAGNVNLQAYETGTTTAIFPNLVPISLLGTDQYTIVLDGVNADNTAVETYLDDNTVPTSGNVEIRVIDASPSFAAGSVDVYILPEPVVGSLPAPTISGLSDRQASGYQSIAYVAPVSGNTNYEVIVTASGNKTPVLTQSYGLQNGSITTLVLVDVQGGSNGMSEIPLELNDLQ